MVQLQACLFLFGGKVVSFLSLVAVLLKVLRDQDLKGHASQSKGTTLLRQASLHHIPCTVMQMLFSRHVRGKVGAAAGHLLEVQLKVI